MFARALRERGHEIQVLTGFPNYPGGKLYPGYKVRCLQAESVDGIEVLRVPLYPSHDRSSLRRALNYCSFGLSSAALGPWLVRQPDVAYVFHPPATIGMPALALRYLRRIPFVLDIQDLWPDTLAATGMLSNPLAHKVLGYCCKMVYRAARRIVVLSPGFKTALMARGVPASKLRVIYNWCDAAGLGSKNKVLPEEEERLLSGKFNIVFAGNLGAAQALQAVLECAALLADRHPSIQFVFVGDGIAKGQLQAQARQRGMANAIFLPRRPIEKVGAVLDRADVLLVHLKDDPLFQITVPSKTQAYLAAGRPILVAVRGDAAELVRKAEAGLTCEPENAASLAGAVERFFLMSAAAREELGRSGRRYYNQHLSLERGVANFEEIFQEICDHRDAAGHAQIPAGWAESQSAGQ